jgi:tetratricopeptide (TPR) repeat protein
MSPSSFAHRRARLRLRLCLALGACALGGCQRFEVVRVIDGQPVTGPFVSPRAYAAYARGTLDEASGHDVEALHAFEVALVLDQGSPELWTRVGAVRCRLGQVDSAEEAFDQGEQRDADYEPLWRARAECERSQHRLPDAVQAARRAVRLDPDRLETALLWARLADELGQTDEAGRWLRSLVARWPRSRAAWRALAEFAQHHGQAPWAARAAEELGTLPAADDEPPLPAQQAVGSSWHEVDAALQAADLPAARRALRQRHLDEHLLAPRAVALGKPGLAQEQAAAYVAADPTDSDSRLALALAADLLGRSVELSRLLTVVPGASPLSPVARLLLRELLARHVGPAEAGLVGPSPPRVGTPPSEADERAVHELEAVLSERLPSSSAPSRAMDGAATPR